MAENYYRERNAANVKKIRELRENLPIFCTEFFLGIEPRTTPLTRLNYCYDLKAFFEFISQLKYGNKPIRVISLTDLDGVTTTDLELFLEHLTSYEDSSGKTHACAERSKARHLSCVKSLCRYFFRKDKLHANVAANVDLPKLHDKEIIRLEVDEVVKLLDETESGGRLTERQRHFHSRTKIRDTALLTLLLGTGIRVSECVGLNVEDFDFQTNGFKVIRKGGSSTILYFSDEVALAIKTYINVRKDLLDVNSEECALFVSLQKKRITTRAVQVLVKKYSKLITPLKKITPHKLRSTYGTSLYRETKDIYIVADVLGHRDVNTTKKHYAAISDDLRRDVANKIKLREDDKA
ncbi:MAG: tyrosine-type recombinase/integrase [Clostridiales bacterium]|nr:tyrosine-type recombinase/integrase [Clostridiales bacterium]